MRPIGGWRKDTDNDSERSADRKAKRSTNRRALNAEEKRRTVKGSKHSTRDAGS